MFSGRPISSHASLRAVSHTFSPSFDLPIVNKRPAKSPYPPARRHRLHGSSISCSASSKRLVNSHYYLRKVISAPKPVVSMSRRNYYESADS